MCSASHSSQASSTNRYKRKKKAHVRPVAKKMEKLQQASERTVEE